MNHFNMQCRINAAGETYWYSIDGVRVSKAKYNQVNDSKTDSDSYYTTGLKNGGYAHGHIARVAA